MRIRIFDNAKFDLADGYEFYELRADGLGAYFLDSLYSDIDSLILFAGVHRVRVAGFHCLLSKRFPFAIYYEVESDLISVFAVMDCRQDPLKIEERLKSESKRQWNKP